MKIAFASDLHLDIFPEKALQDIYDEFRGVEADVLALAGDISEIVHLQYFEDFFEIISKQFKKVLYIPGNHEYYRSQFTTFELENFLSKFSNIHVMNNNTKKIGGIRFIGSTLWTSLDNENSLVMYQSSKAMNDYRMIKNGAYTFTPEDSVAEYKQSLKYIQKTVAAANEKGDRCVVITHHGPSERSIKSHFWDKTMFNPNINYNYFSPILDKGLIEFEKDALWIHGHVHTVNDYWINNVRVVTNPGGYPGERFDNNEEQFSVTILEV